MITSATAWLIPGMVSSRSRAPRKGGHCLLDPLVELSDGISDRLSTEIEYSQPVIYKHFASMEDLVEAIALEGFAELAEALGDARRHAAPAEAVSAVVRAYNTYATENPALYEAMFTRAMRLRFGIESPAAQPSAAYAELRTAVATIA